MCEPLHTSPAIYLVEAGAQVGSRLSFPLRDNPVYRLDMSPPVLVQIEPSDLAARQRLREAWLAMATPLPTSREKNNQ
jgi:hypothetical protein